MVAAFQSKQHEDEIAESDGDESDTDSITPEESEELFPDQEENESEVENWCDVRKIGKKHLSVGSVQVA